MWNERKIMQAGMIAAALLIIIRILLEQIGVPFLVSSAFGVVWLYFILPVIFAVAIRNGALPNPYLRLLKDVILFAVYSRVLVAITYVLAHYLHWTAMRFSTTQGGTVGPQVQSLQSVLFIVVRNALIWVVMATIIGMITGLVALLLKKKGKTGQ